MNRFGQPARFWWGRLFIFVIMLLGAPPAWAERSSSDEGLSEKEIYERDMIRRALDSLGLTPEPAPEGKRIERVELVRLPIIEASDPWPDFINLFHVTTRDHIVRQELLFAVGEQYDEDKVRESARNLRLLPLLFSTVRLLTARGSRPDRVVVVVITKDLWSIRLNSNFSFGGGVFNYFYLTPSEQNFLGFNQRVSLHYYLDRDVQNFGQVYHVPRLFGSRWMLYESGAVRINHHSSEVEGGYGNVLVGRPLFSLDTEWGFYLQGSFDLGIDRYYEGADYRRVRIIDGETEYLVPQDFSHRNFAFSADVRRSFGQRYKTNLVLAYGLHARDYGLTDTLRSLPTHLQTLYRQAIVPIDDRAGSVSLSVSFFEARYERLQNVQTLGLTEDFRVGPSASASLAWANPSFGFSQHSLGLSVALGWRFFFLGDLLDLSASASARFMPDNALIDAPSAWIDQYYELQAENVSPVLGGLGRLFLRVHYRYSQFTRGRTLYTLGGDNTLRGFVSGFTAGPRVFNVNAEFRTVPWVLWTVHLGLVAFYDGGDAYGFTRQDDFAYHQAVGLGIRGLFPQFDRGTFRLDVGVPLGRDFHTRVVDWVSIAFLQAF